MKFWLTALPWISRIAAAPHHSYSVSPKGFILEDGAPMSFTGVNAMHVFGVRQRVICISVLMPHTILHVPLTCFYDVINEKIGELGRVAFNVRL